MTLKEFDGNLQSNQAVTIGIDQSLTGFALSAVSVESPALHKTWVYKSPYKGVQRLNDIGNWLADRLYECDEKGWTVQDIAMEGTVLASQSALALGELSAVVKLTLFNNTDILPLQIPPMTLKKYAAGKGTAKKQEMLLQIYKRFGLEFNDDNAADAYALARLAGGHTLNAVDAQIVEQIKDPKYRDTIL